VEGPRDGDSVAEFLNRIELPASVARGRGIGDVAALMKRSDLVICNDTGVMHVAAAAGATTLAVFGPTDPDRWAPRTDCLNIIRAPEGKLVDLSIGEVADRAAQILDHRNL